MWIVSATSLTPGGFEGGVFDRDFSHGPDFDTVIVAPVFLDMHAGADLRW